MKTPLVSVLLHALLKTTNVDDVNRDNYINMVHQGVRYERREVGMISGASQEC